MGSRSVGASRWTPPGRRDLADKFWTDFRTRFDCKDLVPEPRKYVGLEISRDRKKRTLTLTQTDYIDKMADKFLQGDHTKAWNLPVDPDDESLSAFMSLKPAADDAGAIQVLEDGFMSIIGSLLFASAMTRPDISFHVATLARLMQRPTKVALHHAIGVLSYLKKTRKMGITYGRSEDIEHYADSSWGRSPHPMAGHCTIYGGAALSWASKALKIVPLSSAEAESAVLSLGCKDAMFLKQLLAELRPNKLPPCMTAFTDNTACIDIVKAHGTTARTKHFERWIAYIRDLYQRSIINVKHVTTDKMPADIFTKALPYEPFTKFRSFLLGKP